MVVRAHPWASFVCSDISKWRRANQSACFRCAALTSPGCSTTSFIPGSAGTKLQGWVAFDWGFSYRSRKIVRRGTLTVVELQGSNCAPRKSLVMSSVRPRIGVL